MQIEVPTIRETTLSKITGLAVLLSAVLVADITHAIVAADLGGVPPAFAWPLSAMLLLVAAFLQLVMLDAFKKAGEKLLCSLVFLAFTAIIWLGIIRSSGML